MPVTIRTIQKNPERKSTVMRVQAFPERGHPSSVMELSMDGWRNRWRSKRTLKNWIAQLKLSNKNIEVVIEE